MLPDRFNNSIFVLSIDIKPSVKPATTPPINTKKTIKANREYHSVGSSGTGVRFAYVVGIRVEINTAKFIEIDIFNSKKKIIYMIHV